MKLPQTICSRDAKSVSEISLLKFYLDMSKCTLSENFIHKEALEDRL